MKMKLFSVIFLIFCLAIDNTFVYADEPADLNNQQDEESISATEADQLSVNLVLTGTIVQNDPSRNIAQLIVEGQQAEQSFLVGDEIFDGIVLLNVDKEKVLVEHQDQKYWIVINSSTHSDVIAYVPYSIASSADRLDSPEFYNEDGILMEGAAALKYGVDLDAAPVVEQVDIDARLESLPEGVKMRNGIPKTWWNPQNLTHTPPKQAESLKNNNKPLQGAAVSSQDKRLMRRQQRQMRRLQMEDIKTQRQLNLLKKKNRKTENDSNDD